MSQLNAGQTSIMTSHGDLADCEKAGNGNDLDRFQFVLWHRLVVAFKLVPFSHVYRLISLDSFVL